MKDIVSIMKAQISGIGTDDDPTGSSSLPAGLQELKEWNDRRRQIVNERTYPWGRLSTFSRPSDYSQLVQVKGDRERGEGGEKATAEVEDADDGSPIVNWGNVIHLETKMGGHNAVGISEVAIDLVMKVMAGEAVTG